VELDYDAGTLRRHWRTVVLITLIAGGLVAVRSLGQTPVYEATASVLVRPLGATSIQTGLRPDQLVSMAEEKRIMQSDAVAAIAGRKLQVRATPSQLLEHLSVDVPADSQILRVHFRYVVPETAQRGANAFAEAFLAFRKEDVRRRVTNSRSSLQRQIAALAAKKARQDAISAPDNPATPQQRRNALELADSYSKQKADLEQQLATLQQLNLSPGTVIEPAEPPTSTAGRMRPAGIALGLLVGLGTGVLVAFVRERSDPRLRGPADLAERLGRPVLGQIPWLRRRRRRAAQRPGSRRPPRRGWSRPPRLGLAMLDQPEGPAAEAYRSLRARLTQLELTSIMVVSPGPGEGKSTTAANLAVTLAESGREVLLVSADLRRPRIHEFFGLPNGSGLSDLLLDGLPDTTGEYSPTDGRQRTALELWSVAPHLLVMLSGPLPPHPSTLLDSRTMNQFLKEQGELFDLIVLDCPPALVPDSLVLASLVDGVLVVVDAKQTDGSAVSAVRNELDHLGGKLIGAVLNRAPRGRQRFYV
jgi:polysaccharide biosynthesis transport protein